MPFCRSNDRTHALLAVSLMQVGVCLFHEEEVPTEVSAEEEVCIDDVPAANSAPPATTRIVATPFNFYVFPDAKAGGRIVMFSSTVRLPPEGRLLAPLVRRA